MESSAVYNRNDAEAVAIRKKAEQLAVVYADFKLFDVIALDAVRKFEAEHQVRLPDDYVWFITNVGNGGTWQPVMGGGWDYQFYPLEKTYFSRKAPDRNAAVPDSETGTDKYALDVLSKGCSYSFGIILAGEHYGEISDDSDGDAFYNEKPVHGFKELYLKWLDEFSLGYDIVRFDERLHGTIEEHLEQYKHCVTAICCAISAGRSIKNVPHRSLLRSFMMPFCTIFSRRKTMKL